MFNDDRKLIERMAPALKRALVIDPSTASSRMLADLMRSLTHCQVWVAPTAGKAMELLKAIDPQIIFIEHAARGTTPADGWTAHDAPPSLALAISGSPSGGARPSIVNVLPAPVWPYARTQPDLPLRNRSTSGATDPAYTSACVDAAPQVAANSKARRPAPGAQKKALPF